MRYSFSQTVSGRFPINVATVSRIVGSTIISKQVLNNFVISVFRIRAAFLVIFFIFLCRYLLCRVSTPSDGEFTKEQLIEDEAVDCQIVKFLKKEILSQSNSVPKEFVLKVVMLLTKGSVLSPAHDVIISEYSRRSGCGWTVTVAFHFTLHN